VTGFSMLFGASTSYGSDYAYSEALANPFQIEGLASVGRVFEDGLQDVVLNSVGLGGIIIMVIRYIVTTKIERKQMRWVIVGFFVAFAAISAQEASTISDDVVFASTVGLIIGSFSLPLSIAMGVLFYRLWDVDVIIRRTFTYAILSALLVGTYLLIVLVFQSLLSGVIASDSSAVIVISTLTVAILFNPLRHRVQRIIDRTFYRKRYDAEATLEAFSEKIRHATEADAIQQYLIESVASTIQPESIGLWLVDSSAKPQL